MLENLENENFPLIFGVLALVFLFLTYEFSIRIKIFLVTKYPGELFSTFRIFKNAAKYKAIKQSEENKTGRGYFAFYTTFYLFVFFTVLTLLLLVY